MKAGGLFVFTAVAALSAVVACSSDEGDDGGGSGGSSGSAGGSGGTGGTAGSAGTGATGGSSGTAGTGGTSSCDNTDATFIEMCRSQAAAMNFAGTCEELANCACDNCACELQACQNDTGCVAIRDCATSNGCRGVACYAAETCMAEIDANGGPFGPGASLALALNDCTEMVPCPTMCPGGSGGAGGGGGQGGGGAGTPGDASTD